jgi:hypothetical protein
MPKAIPLCAVVLTAAMFAAACGSPARLQVSADTPQPAQGDASMQPLTQQTAIQFKEAVALARAAIILAKRGNIDNSYDMLQMAKASILKIDLASLTPSQRGIINQVRQAINNALDGLEVGDQTNVEDRNAVIRDLSSVVDTDFSPIIGKL